MLKTRSSAPEFLDVPHSQWNRVPGSPGAVFALGFGHRPGAALFVESVGLLLDMSLLLP